MDAFLHPAGWQTLTHAEPRAAEFPVRPVVRLGVIGGALRSAVGRAHFAALQICSGFRIDAGCFSRDRNENARTRDYLRMSSEHVFASAEDLISNAATELDAVLILTPTPDHLNQVRMAMEAGLSVISEKALTANIADCSELLQVQKVTQQSLNVTYNYSGYPFVRELRARVLRGDLGRILKAVIEMPQEGFLKLDQNGQPVVPQSWRLVDGDIPTVSLDLGVHCHHMLQFITDKPLVPEWARHASLGNFPEVVDDVECAGVLGQEGQFSMWFGKAALGHRNGLRVRLYGSEGAATWYQAKPDELHLFSRSGHAHRLDFGSPDLLVANKPRYMRFKAGHPTGFIEAFANLYEDIAGHLTGIPFPGTDKAYVPTIDDAKEGLKFLHAANELAN